MRTVANSIIKFSLIAEPLLLCGDVVMTLCCCW